MTETTTPPPLPPTAPAAPRPKWWETPAWQKFQRWFMIVCAAIVGLLGLLKLYHAFVPQIPGCDASDTTDLIRSIFKQRDIELTTINGVALVSESSSERNCRAHIETSSETATIEYRITLEGSQFKVFITKVDAHGK